MDTNKWDVWRAQAVALCFDLVGKIKGGIYRHLVQICGSDSHHLVLGVAWWTTTTCLCLSVCISLRSTSTRPVQELVLVRLDRVETCLTACLPSFRPWSLSTPCGSWPSVFSFLSSIRPRPKCRCLDELTCPSNNGQ